MEDRIVLKFGDVFRLDEEKEFVFLHLTTDFIYAARIFNTFETQKVNELYESKLKKGQLNAANKNHAIYSFVMLTTEEYKERMASFAKPQEDANIRLQKIGTINEEDLKAIKKEILSDGCTIAKIVKEYVKSLS